MSKKPISKKQLAANRRNAQKSTGPKTPEGKKRSSCNDVKHGLLARQIIIDDGDPNEKPEELERLLRALIRDFGPADTCELLLVQRVAVSFWRIRRAYRYESQAILDQREGPKDLAGQMIAQINPSSRDPYELILPRMDELNKLLRYAGAIDRELNRSLNQLRRLQNDRQQNNNPNHDRKGVDDSEPQAQARG